MSLRITTNHVPRDIVDACELTPKEREWHDYLDWPAIERGEDSASFVRYKGWTYSLGEFTRSSGDGELAGWDGHLADSFFSGVLIEYAPGSDYEQVIMARFYQVGD